MGIGKIIGKVAGGIAGSSVCPVIGTSAGSKLGGMLGQAVDGDKKEKSRSGKDNDFIAMLLQALYGGKPDQEAKADSEGGLNLSAIAGLFGGSAQGILG